MRVRCKECGQTWEPRYEKEEYEQFGGDRRLRCTAEDCHNGKQDGFEVIDEPDETAPPRSAVGAARLETQRDILRGDLTETFRELVGTEPGEVEKADSLGEFRESDAAPSGSTNSAPDGLEAAVTRLYNLWTHLDDVDTFDAFETFQGEVSDALDAVEIQRSYLDEKKQLETDIERLTAEIDELEVTAGDLREKISDLEAEQDRLKARRDELESETDAAETALERLQKEATTRGFTSVEAILKKLEEIENLREEEVAIQAELDSIVEAAREAEDREEAFEEGLEEGRERWQIEIPCDSCNKLFPLEPLSRLHTDVANAYIRRCSEHHLLATKDQDTDRPWT